MRMAMLMLGLGLAGCTGGILPGEQPAPARASAEGAPAATAAPTTNARSTASDQPPPALDSLQLTQARVDCWAKVEQQKALRDIDRRIAFVDKCVAEITKAAP